MTSNNPVPKTRPKSLPDPMQPQTTAKPIPAPAAGTHADQGQVRAWVTAVKGGDPEAFGALVALYQNKLFALCLMMLRNPADAEDVAQDAFVRAFTKLELYDQNRPFYPWLATIAVRLVQTRLIGRRRGLASETDIQAAEAMPDGATSALQILVDSEEGHALWQAVSKLPARQRTAVFLYYRQDMKVSEVARALGVTTGTVKTLLSRARATLNTNLSPDIKTGDQS